MVTINKTRMPEAAEKKTRSISSVTLKASDFVGLTAGDTLALFALPEKALIRSAYIVVQSASQASVTAGIGTAPSGTQLGATRALSAVAVVGGAVATPVDTGTGAVVYFTPSAIPTQGEFDVIVEYDEYRLGNGNLTNYLNF